MGIWDLCGRNGCIGSIRTGRMRELAWDRCWRLKRGGGGAGQSGERLGGVLSGGRGISSGRGQDTAYRRFRLILPLPKANEGRGPGAQVGTVEGDAEVRLSVVPEGDERGYGPSGWEEMYT